MKFHSGFKNLGNTCYFNSILQALIHTFPLTRHILHGEYKKDEYQSTREAFFANTYFKLLVDYSSSDKQLMDVKNIFVNFSTLSKEFRDNEQKDAYLCLLRILDILHIALTIDNAKIDINGSDYPEAIKEYETYIKDNGFSYIFSTFYGQQKKGFECTVCNTVSCKYDMFNSLSLDMNKDTLEDCILDYFKSDELEKKCDKCDINTPHKLTLLVSKYPDVFIIHLKRFDNNCEKIDKFIKIPDTIALNKNEYFLYSTVNHSGTIDDGHYVNCSRINTADWHVFNDNCIFETTKFNVQENYILFYQRK
jgi:ubiquitin C-terminal hydrolase